MEISPPKYVKTILKTLASHGHLACIVGGCVRDMVLGVAPNDWDVATSALPEEVMELFPDSKGTGIKHGTVTVKIGSKSAEVTTFRTDGEYKDHRHPEAVNFIGDLTGDLARRDFTVNAMAITSDGTFMDPFHGLEDIKNHLIRAVGEPAKRFEEDALRMLRAFRFSSRLEFEIEEETMRAIRDNAHLAGTLAPERVRDEVEKILMSVSPSYLYDLIDCGLLDRYLNNHLSRRDGLDCIADMPKKALPRFAAFCTVLEADECIDSTWDFLTSLRLDGRTINCCSASSSIVKTQPPEDRVTWKRLLRKYGVDAVECAASVWDAFYGTGNTESLKSVLKSGECFSVRHLAINGNDIASFGYKGKQIGEMLEFLLDYVIEYPENNTHEKLMILCSNSDQ